MYNALLFEDHKIIAITETWCSADLLDQEVIPTFYQTYRTDRRLEKRGGGVLVAIHSTLQQEPLDLSILNDNFGEIDTTGAKVFINKRPLLLLVLYMPPNVHTSVIAEYFDALALFLLEYVNIVVVGDFNMPGYDTSIAPDYRSRLLMDFLGMLQLKQVNEIRNSIGRRLDLVAVSENCIVHVNKAPLHLVREDKFHPCLDIEIKMSTQKQQNFVSRNVTRSFNFRRANFVELYNEILTLDWGKIDQNRSVNEMCNIFYDLIFTVVRKHVPMTRGRGRSYPCWFNQQIIELMRQKDLLYKKSKRSKNKADISNYRTIRSLCRSVSNDAFKNYLDEIENDMCNNPKKFWQYIKLKRKSTRIPGCMFYRGAPIRDPVEITEAFATYFRGVYQDSVGNDEEYLQWETICIEDIKEIEIVEAAKQLRKLNSIGDDGLPTFIVKDCIRIWAPTLRAIFNKSLQDGIFPHPWKRTRIIPIYKSGAREKVENYRPVAILPAFAKIFEIVLYNRMYHAVKSKISLNQHGFMEGDPQLRTWLH